MSQTMKTRITLGSAMLVALAGLFWLDLYWDGFFVCLAVMIVAGLALYEIFTMAENAGFRPFTWPAILIGVAILPYYLWIDSVHFSVFGQRLMVALLLAPILAVALVPFALAFFRRNGIDQQLKNISATVFGILYISLPMVFLLRIRFLDEGWRLVVLVIIVTKASDIGAYFAGSLFGRHKLAPQISPNKTVEGMAGGIFLSAAAAIAMAKLMDIQTLEVYGLLLTLAFGAGIGLASVAGDLMESLIKRSTNTKDSGNWLPAFGGVLDLVDSIIMAAPVAYFALALFSHFAKGA